MEGECTMEKYLATLKKGDSGKVKLIYAGRCATRRLYEMGFNIGAPIRIIKNDSGPVIVSINGNKIALGRGLAEKIMLEA